MTRDEMRVLLDRTKFRPFRVYVDDGTTYDITNPRRALAGSTWFVVGVPDPKDPESDIAEHFEHVDWETITKVEHLESPSVTE